MNFELTYLNYDASFVRAVEAMLSDDFDRSRAVDLAEYSERSFAFRLLSRSARLLAPLP